MSKAHSVKSGGFSTINVEELAREVSLWLKTDKGKKAMDGLRAQNEQMVERLRNARQISPERLREPMTF